MAPTPKNFLMDVYSRDEIASGCRAFRLPGWQLSWRAGRYVL
jgi:hypothetical protein